MERNDTRDDCECSFERVCAYCRDAEVRRAMNVLRNYIRQKHKRQGEAIDFAKDVTPSTMSSVKVTSDLTLVLHPYTVSVDLHGRERTTGRTTICHVSLVATCKWLELETRGYLHPQSMMRVHATCNVLDIHACVKDGTVREAYTALLEWLEIIAARMAVKS